MTNQTTLELPAENILELLKVGHSALRLPVTMQDVFMIGEIEDVIEPFSTHREKTDVERSHNQKLWDDLIAGKTKKGIKGFTRHAQKIKIGSGKIFVLYKADFGEWADHPDSDLTWQPAIEMPAAYVRLRVKVAEVETTKDGVVVRLDRVGV